MSAFPIGFGGFGLPGVTTSITSDENNPWFGREVQNIYSHGVLDGDSVDAGNTVNTSVLRAGMALGRIASNGQLAPWSPTATNGTQYLYGYLGLPIDCNPTGAGTPANRAIGLVLVGGQVDPTKILVAGEADYDITDDNELLWVLMAQSNNRFMYANYFDFPARSAGVQSYDAIDTTGAATLTAADTHKNFLMDYAGAMAVTVPAPLPGLQFTFYNMVDQNVVVTTTGANQAIGVTTAASGASHIGNTISVSTSTKKQGAAFRLKAVNSSYYIVELLTDHPVLVTDV